MMKNFLFYVLTAFLLLSGCQNQPAATSASGQPAAMVDKGVNNPVIQTIMARRSVRKYKPEPVPRDQMKVILECGINAPNGMNAQPWEVRVTDSKEFIDGITKLYVESVQDDERMAKMIQDENFQNMFRNAPSVIFIANKKGSGQIDCGLMGGNMILAAQSMGFGTCCLGGAAAFLKTPAAVEYLKRLDFSEDYELLYAIAVGYPDESPEQKSRDASKVKFID